jgi:hypothetical protein
MGRAMVGCELQVGVGNYRNTVTEGGPAVLHESGNTVCDEEWVLLIRVRGLC